MKTQTKNKSICFKIISSLYGFSILFGGNCLATIPESPTTNPQKFDADRATLPEHYIVDKDGVIVEIPPTPAEWPRRSEVEAWESTKFDAKWGSPIAPRSSEHKDLLPFASSLSMHNTIIILEEKIKKDPTVPAKFLDTSAPVASR